MTDDTRMAGRTVEAGGSDAPAAPSTCPRCAYRNGPPRRPAPVRASCRNCGHRYTVLPAPPVGRQTEAMRAHSKENHNG